MKGKAKKVLKVVGITILYIVCLFTLLGAYLQTDNVVLAGILILLLIAAPVSLILFLAWKIYKYSYFKTRFSFIKLRVQNYIFNCNELNRHIESLKDTQLEINRTDYGTAKVYDNSLWNVNANNLQNQKYAPHIYNCSKAICGNARNRPFEYVCKYFGIEKNEESLEKFEAMLNSFEAVEEGKALLMQERASILASVLNDIPVLIKKFCMQRVTSELGFEEVDFSTMYFPRYVFSYVSDAGYKGERVEVVMDIENLNRFIEYLSQQIKFRKSAAGQRALMTSKLRQSIKERDNFTCKQCGASIEQEPHLLLEIDHIIPVSKGGLTTEDNLQTLCWRCNRSKGAKV